MTGPESLRVHWQATAAEFVDGTRMALDLTDPFLDSSERLFAIVARTNRLGISISRYSDGRLLAVNDAYLFLFGYTREEVIGKTTLELGIWLEPQDRARFIEWLSLEREGGNHYEGSFRKKNGEIRQFLLSAQVTELGGEMYFVGVLTDITAKQLAEKALRESEQRYRVVVQGQSELIARFRADNTMLFVNEVFCRFFGRRPEEIIGHKWHPLPHPDDIPHIHQKLASLAVDTPVVIIENRVFDARGAVRWMQFVNSAFFDDGGQITEIQSVGRDITVQKEAEIALQDAKDDLERRVSERTRQLQLLASRLVQKEEEVRQDIARDLHDGLGQLLHLARIKLDSLTRASGQSAFKDSVEELFGIVQTASDRVRQMTMELAPPVLERLGLLPALRWLAEQMERHYGMTVEVIAEHEDISIDKVRSAVLYRAARELLINVHKHAQTLFATVEIAPGKDHLILTVSDQGVGMQEGDALISTDRGFGLFSVQEQMTLFGGTMTLKTARNYGTSAILVLPLLDALPR